MAANVNKPTDNKQKEADINRKLQIYGIISAFKHGKIPSNDQADVALNSFLASKSLSSPDELSDDGKQLVQDTREVVQLAKKLLLSKNDGNLIQDFIWQTTQFDPKSIRGPDTPVNKDTAKRDGDDALQGLRTLGTLLITNGQFRKLLQDSTVLLRDMIGDAASGAAGRIRPSEEQLSQIDRAAEDNTWHDAPNLSKENLKKQAKGIYGGSAMKDAQDVASASADATVPQGNTGQPVDKVVVGQNAAMTVARQKIDQNLDPETREKIKKRNEEYRRKTKEYFNKKMPQERKEQVIFRLKKMILECQQHPDYSQAIQTLLRLAESYGSHGRSLGKGSAGTAKQARSSFQAAEDDLRTLVERFANGTSTSDLWASIGQIYKDADNDQELKGWFKNMDKYIRRCLLEQGYILDESSTKDWDRLYEHGRYLLREKYRTHTDRVIDETKFVADQFDKDPQNKAFGQAVQKLFSHLGHDESGKLAFKPQLVKDLTEVILPSLLQNISYIPIPRIEYSDHQFDAAIENLVLESDNFMPNVAEVASEHYFRWGRKKIANKHHNTMDIKVAGIQMDLRDVSFHVKRKSGFPSISDTGVADILLPGNGLSFRLKVSTAHKSDRQNIFKVDKVDVDFKGLNIKLKESSHKLLFAIVKPLMLQVLRPPIQKAVEKAIKDECNKLDQMLFQIKQEADRPAKESRDGEAAKKASFHQRYYQAAQKRFLDGKEKGKGATDDKKVHIAMTMEGSILPNVKLPGSVSSKAAEYKELARKGEKWESPVFSVGSAGKSTDIPAVPRIESKAHPAGVTPRGVNGASHAVTNGAGRATSSNTAGMVLNGKGTRALFDILTHHETYAEIEAFKSPDAVTNYGFPFARRTVAPAQQQQQQQQLAGRWWRGPSTTTTPVATAPSTPRAGTPVPFADTASKPGSEPEDGEDEPQQLSSSPLLQTLLTQFVLPLPGVRTLPREFWSVRVQGLMARLGEAELSESYDKGAVGTRKTLATGASAVIEMLGRAALGGVERAHESADNEARGEYDYYRAEDLVRAWEDVVQGLVYGDLVDGLFDHLARTEDLEGYSPAVKAAADYALIHLATFAHHVFTGSPEGQYLLKLLANVHSLVPYKLIKQTLRVGNTAMMMSGMMRLLLAKLSVTSLTNWFGLTQSADDGMNLLQRIVALVLSWDAGEFRKGAERVERNKDDSDRPPEDALQAIRAHFGEGNGAHETVRAASMHNAQSIVVAILSAGDPALAAALTDAQHAQCLSYYSALLSVRDREGITAALCRTPPDLFTQMVRDLAAAYDPMIRSVHARVDVKEHLDALQGFVEDFIRTSRPTTDGDEQGGRLVGVEEYVGLLKRNRGLLYRWVSVVAGGCPDVWGELREWAREAMGRLRMEEDKGQDKEPRSMADSLNDLFASLRPATRAVVLEAIDAHAAYLATLNNVSLAQLQYLITSTWTVSDCSSSSSNSSSGGGGGSTTGPGVYLARWQSLLDSTPITPAAPHGPLRHGRDVRHATTMGKTGVGGRMPEADASREEYGPAAPDVDVVVRALGGGFGDVVREMARDRGQEARREGCVTG
ncbi:Uncharacterized protein TCAP_02554 [Tolypocladium capitatum]|uniref:Uncharacterized protein n=1 Tax=Tolypocladium capitatum TaxID=45235 RepID=A0A2K3QJ07_9HYPO|nr:Uncharacterized protein TCAP_02554 [Tolypocladium capitatum]